MSAIRGEADISTPEHPIVLASIAIWPLTYEPAAQEARRARLGPRRAVLCLGTP